MIPYHRLMWAWYFLGAKESTQNWQIAIVFPLQKGDMRQTFRLVAYVVSSLSVTIIPDPLDQMTTLGRRRRLDCRTNSFNQVLARRLEIWDSFGRCWHSPSGVLKKGCRQLEGIMARNVHDNTLLIKITRPTLTCCLLHKGLLLGVSQCFCLVLYLIL